MIDDPVLLARYAEQGCEEAFAELVRRHLSLVYSAALRRTNGDAHRAHDVAQAVFTALARDAASLANHPALAGWLYTTTRHAAIDMMRAEQRRATREHVAQILHELSSPSAGQVDWNQLRPILDEAMDELDVRDREAVLLRFFQGHPFAAVAAALHVSEDAARKRVDRAVEKLRTLLARRGITSTSAALALGLATETAVAVPAGVTATITTTALAGAGTAGGGAIALALLNVMSTTKVITTTAVVIAALGVGTALYQRQSARESAATLASLQAERDDLHTRLAAMEDRTRESDQTLATTREELETLRRNAAPAAPDPVASNYGQAMNHVLDHPETHAAYVDQQALRALARYDRFIKAAGLRPDQTERLLQEMKELAAVDFDLMLALRTEGYGIGNMPRNAQAMEEIRAPALERRKLFTSNVREILGDDSLLKEFLEYGTTIAERNVADQLAGRLYYTDTPLTSQQADRLMQIVRQHRFNPRASGSSASTIKGTALPQQALHGALAQHLQHNGMTLLEWRAPLSDAALAEAREVLSPPQLAALQQVQAEQFASMQLAPPPQPGFLGSGR